jgi:hypothetical protein
LEVQVARSCLIFAMLVLLSVSPASAQYVRIIQACSRDITQSCGSAPSATRPLVECVRAHFLDFTEPCQAALLQIPEVLKSCGDDIQKQCPGVAPAGGRILLCVKGHFAALSEPCKEAIGAAAERGPGAD